MVRQYSDNDIDAVMQIWLDTNIQAHHFIPSDYWRTNCNMVRETGKPCKERFKDMLFWRVIW